MLDLIADGYDVSAALAELEARPSLWSLFTLRQTAEDSPHHDTECIVLRGPAVPDAQSVFTDLIAYDYPVLCALPETVKLLQQVLPTHLAAHIIGRVIIVKLKAQGSVDMHSDEGSYAEHYDTRIHMVLSSNARCSFYNDGDIAWPKPGELWAFNHRAEHASQNLGDTDRIHIIIDARKPEQS